jgi:TPR repeat protein
MIGIRFFAALALLLASGCTTPGTELTAEERATLGPEMVDVYKRARRGDRDAGLALGKILESGGWGEKARVWFRQGAEEGHLPSQLALGRSYLRLIEQGTATVTEFEERRQAHTEACTWLGRAAEGEEPDAQVLIAVGWAAKGCRRYAQSEGADLSTRYGDSRRQERWSEWWLRKAAAQGHRIAEFQLASLLLRPFWLDRDDVWTEAEKVERIREGADLLIEVARKGFAPAEYRLGVLHMPGYYCRRTALPPTLGCRVIRERIEASASKSLFWYRRAAEENHACAHTAIGSIYEAGAGVPRSLASAHRHYEIAAGLEPGSWQGLDASPISIERDTHSACSKAARAKLVELASRFDPAIAIEVQKQLRTLGFGAGRPDGVLGTRTVAAVKRFQKSLGMYPDGKVNFGLLQRLNQEVRRRTLGRASDPQPRPEALPEKKAAPDPPPAKLSPREHRRRAAKLYDRRVAAVVGIDDYRSWPALEGAKRDARRVAETLRKQGFDEVIEIYDEEATRTRMLTLLGSELAGKTGPDSLALIYFAGHGQTETLRNREKRGYIIPADADRRNVFATAISMDTVRDLSNRIPAKHVFYAMDSCYSGLGLTRGISRIPGTPDYIRKVVRDRAVQMITAGSEGERAIESGGYGLFTTHFLRALEGAADLDGDGFVTASEIGAYIRPEVTRASRSRQTPQFGTLEGAGEVVFLPR